MPAESEWGGVPPFAPGEAQTGRNMVAAARAGGVRKFVFSNVIHPPFPAWSTTGRGNPSKRAYMSPDSITQCFSLRCSCRFSPALALDAGLRPDHMSYSKHAKMAFVDFPDVAEVAALVFVDEVISHGTFGACMTWRAA